MVIVSVYGAMQQWPILVAKAELYFTWIRKFVKKNGVKEFWKKYFGTFEKYLLF